MFSSPVAIAVALLACASVAHGYAGYLYTSNDCSGANAEGFLQDDDECTTFKSRNTVSFKADCINDDTQVTLHQWPTSATCPGTAGSDVTVATGACIDMSSVWGSGSLKIMCTNVERITYQTYSSADCGGNDVMDKKFPEDGCANADTAAISFSATCNLGAPANVMVWNQNYCSGAATSTPGSVENGGCVDLTGIVTGGGSVKITCGASATTVFSVSALFVALFAAARNAFHA